MRHYILFFLLLTSNVVFSQDLSVGLSAYYPFTGNANDASGNNNNAVLNTASLTSDRLSNPNNAYHFNGTDSYIQIPNSASLNSVNQISVCTWVKVTGFNYGACHANGVLNKGDLDFMPGNYLIRFDEVLFAPLGNCNDPLTDSIHQNFRGVSSPSIPHLPYIEKDQWYSVVYTYDGTTARLYVNCELKYTFVSALGFTNSDDLFFGKANNVSFPFWFTGDLDEVRIYNRPLTQDEVNLYGDCTIVPVRITSFNANVIGNKSIQLTWHTEEELDVINYTLERSVSGSDFTPLALVPKKNTNTSADYSFTDHTAKPNTLYYYRIAVNENHGPKKYSVIKTAKIINKEFYTFTYPNPTKGLIKVNIYNPTSDVQINILNNIGQVIAARKATDINVSTVSMDISNAPKGIYWIRIQAGMNKAIEKIIKE